MKDSRRPIRSISAAVVAASVMVSGIAGGLLAGGCAAPPQAAAGAGSGTALERAVEDYEAGLYSAAHRRAVDAMRSGRAADSRAEAAYVAGLAAYRLRDLDEAERRLLTASRSGDRNTSGSAEAMLGQVRLDQDRPADAATHFEAAALALAGEDARRAAEHAALAHEQAGNTAAADRWRDRAQRGVGTKGRFAIQVGAFLDSSRAQHAAREAEPVAGEAGFGRVRIATRTDSRGRTLHVVQFGAFPTRSAADAARARLDRLDYIVAAAAGP